MKTACYLLLIFFFIFNTAFSQESKKVEILNADIVDYDEKLFGKDIKRLIGNVIFKHDNAIMKCDTALFNSTINNIKAYGNIHINQGDTLQLYGDSLFYFGNERLAKVRNKVRLVHLNATLTTNYLDYDRNTNIGYYYNYGKIVNKDNVLESQYGYYYSNYKDFVAVKKVILTNPRYIMNSDTLKYNIDNETAFFFGPTTIVNDSNLIYCENGWYNTKTEKSQFSKNSYLKSKSQTLKGDSMYYERNIGMGISWGNVSIVDTTENIILLGNYAEYFEEPERAFITDKAVFINYSEEDSLYLHADTLRLTTLSDSIGDYKFLTAYYGVRIFRYDFQADCDSLTYETRDSILRFYKDPVLWNEQNQLSSDFIVLFTKNNKPDYVELINSAMIISQEDTIRFNQLKGKNMTGYFNENELYKIEVIGNSQSIYYPKENDDIIGVNQAESSNMDIYLKDKQIEKIIFHTKPTATMFTPNEIAPNELNLKDFKWLDSIRPKQMTDIFIKLHKQD